VCDFLSRLVSSLSLRSFLPPLLLPLLFTAAFADDGLLRLLPLLVLCSLFESGVRATFDTSSERDFFASSRCPFSDVALSLVMTVRFVVVLLRGLFSPLPLLPPLLRVVAVGVSSPPTVIVRRPLDEADAASATD